MTLLRRDSNSDDAIAEENPASENDSRKLILNELRKREWMTIANAVTLMETLPETSADT